MGTLYLAGLRQEYKTADTVLRDKVSVGDINTQITQLHIKQRFTRKKSHLNRASSMAGIR